ncbi:MAG: LysE family transporter [Bacteroidales bacterium]|nr:LysE family transporter [Bacteroidales bacterium]
MILFLLGILGGVALSLFFSFGPAFFSQIQASVHYGFRNAVHFAYGVSSSDILVVSILLLISHSIPIDDMVHILGSKWIVYGGAVVIAGFGLYSMFFRARRASECNDNDRLSFRNVYVPSHINIYFRGLFLNFFNPGIWIYWATLVAIVICGDSEISLGGRYLFFGGVLSSTLGMDILKCKLASLLQRVITFRFLNIINKCIGVILICFAVFMVVSTIPRFERENNQKSIEMMQGIMNTKPSLKGIGGSHRKAQITFPIRSCSSASSISTLIKCPSRSEG